MSRRKSRFGLCLLTSLLVAILPHSNALAASPLIERVPAGWTATEPVYVLNEEAERQTVIALETYEEKLILWQTAYEDLYKQAQEYKEAEVRRWNQVLAEMDEMKATHKRELRAAKVQNHTPGVGVFAGIGYAGSTASPQFVFGVGLTIKVVDLF